MFISVRQNLSKMTLFLSKVKRQKQINKIWDPPILNELKWLKLFKNVALIVLIFLFQVKLS